MKNIVKRLAILACGISLGALYGNSALASNTKYRVVEIGDIGPNCYTVDINEKGEAVGNCDLSKAFFYSPTAGLKEIRPLPGYTTYLEVAAINDNGVATGTACRQSLGWFLECEAYGWDVANGMRLLSDPWDTSKSWALDINNRAAVVGFSIVPNEWDPYTSQHFAFYGTLKTGAIHPQPASTTSTHLIAVNNKDVALQCTFKRDDTPVNCATVKKDGSKVSFGLPPTNVNGTLAIVGKDINDAGDAVGWMQIDTGLYRAYLWSQDAGYLELDNSTTYVSEAHGINSKRQVVGIKGMDGWPPSFPFLWDEQSGLVDLRALLDPSDPYFGNFVMVPSKINDKGQIVGKGGMPANARAIILTPIQ